jgi:trehalose synthase
VFEVTVPVPAPDRLGDVLGDAQSRALDLLGHRAREGLAGHTVWNVSSTATGGGVAEMLPGLVGHALAAGIDTRWLVVEGTSPFFVVTKRIHNGLHASPGDDGDLGEAERRIYEATLSSEVHGLRQVLRPGDVVVLHDPQTVGLAEVVRACGATVIWRCHVGTGTHDEWTERAWSFLRPYLRAAAASVFSRAEYIPGWMLDDGGTTVVIPPAIDPLSAKNVELDPGRIPGVLTAAGLLDGTPGAEGCVRRPATLLRDGGPFPRDVPLVVQVSRWDRLKDMAGVLEAFVEGVVDGGTGAHLLLAGPSVAGVSDDPEGVRVLAEVTAAWRALPARARSRVGLASLDMSDVDENALVVNALQRHAAVVTQKSLREGFGLTVAEAMWKSRPVVAAAVGGIQDQIDDGVSGRLVDPTDRRAFAAAIDELLDDPAASRRLGAAAHQRIHDRFLPDRQLSQWLDLVLRVTGR